MIYLVIEGKINNNEKALEQRAFLIFLQIKELKENFYG